MQEDRMQWAEMRVPYQCRLEIPEASPDMVSYLTADPGAIRCGVQADADGEERVILAEADIPIRMWLYRDISKKSAGRCIFAGKTADTETKTGKNPAASYEK